MKTFRFLKYMMLLGSVTHVNIGWGMESDDEFEMIDNYEYAKLLSKIEINKIIKEYNDLLFVNHENLDVFNEAKKIKDYNIFCERINQKIRNMEKSINKIKEKIDDDNHIDDFLKHAGVDNNVLIDQDTNLDMKKNMTKGFINLLKLDEKEKEKGNLNRDFYMLVRQLCFYEKYAKNHLKKELKNIQELKAMVFGYLVGNDIEGKEIESIIEKIKENQRNYEKKQESEQVEKEIIQKKLEDLKLAMPYILATYCHNFGNGLQTLKDIKKQNENISIFSIKKEKGYEEMAQKEIANPTSFYAQNADKNLEIQGKKVSYLGLGLMGGVSQKAYDQQKKDIIKDKIKEEYQWLWGEDGKQEPVTLVAIDEKEKAIIIAFRGTAGLNDGLADGKGGLTKNLINKGSPNKQNYLSFNVNADNEEGERRYKRDKNIYETAKEVIQKTNLPEIGNYHLGFVQTLDRNLHANNDQKESCDQHINNLLNDQKYKDYKIHIVGHSLGGACATLMAYRLKTEKGYKNRKIQLTTIGAPRAVDMKTSRDIEKILGLDNIARFATEGDPVPMVPANGGSMMQVLINSIENHDKNFSKMSWFVGRIFPLFEYLKEELANEIKIIFSMIGDAGEGNYAHVGQGITFEIPKDQRQALIDGKLQSIVTILPEAILKMPEGIKKGSVEDAFYMDPANHGSAKYAELLEHALKNENWEKSGIKVEEFEGGMSFNSLQRPHLNRKKSNDNFEFEEGKEKIGVEKIEEKK